MLLLLLRVSYSAVAAIRIEHFRLDRVALDEFVIVGLVLIDGLVQVHHRMDQPRLVYSFGASKQSALPFGSRMGRGAVRISVLGSILNLQVYHISRCCCIEWRQDGGGQIIWLMIND